MNKIRAHLDRGYWIPTEMRTELEQKWSTDEWKAKAKKNSDNRRSSDGPLHTGGSIPATEHYKRLVSLCYYMVLICLSQRLGFGKDRFSLNQNCLITGIVTLIVPFQIVVSIWLLYLLRHPILRSPFPTLYENWVRRMPSKLDSMI